MRMLTIWPTGDFPGGLLLIRMHWLRQHSFWSPQKEACNVEWRRAQAAFTLTKFQLHLRFSLMRLKRQIKAVCQEGVTYGRIHLMVSLGVCVRRNEFSSSVFTPYQSRQCSHPVQCIWGPTLLPPSLWGRSQSCRPWRTQTSDETQRCRQSWSWHQSKRLAE